MSKTNSTQTLLSRLSSLCGNLPHWRRHATRKGSLRPGDPDRIGRNDFERLGSHSQCSSALQVWSALLRNQGRILAMGCGH